MLKAKLRVHNSELRNLSSKIEKGVSGHILNRMRSQAPKLESAVRTKLATMLWECATIQSCLPGGQLYAELGIEDSATRIRELITHWVNSVHVVVSGRRNPVLRLYGVKASYDDVLGEGLAMIDTKSGTWNWVEWLLTRGSDSILDYSFVQSFSDGKSLAPWSRTGTGAMLKRNGKQWSMPSEYVGTPTDNFILRILNSSEFISFLQQQMLKVIT